MEILLCVYDKMRIVDVVTKVVRNEEITVRQCYRVDFGLATA